MLDSAECLCNRGENRARWTTNWLCGNILIGAEPVSEHLPVEFSFKSEPPECCLEVLPHRIPIAPLGGRQIVQLVGRGTSRRHPNIVDPALEY